jgi:hypothetical protein
LEIVWNVGAVAKLAGAVVSPAPEDSVGFGRTSMVVACADGIPVIACADLSGHRSLGGGSVAELTERVVAPAPQCVVGFGGTSM